MEVKAAKDPDSVKDYSIDWSGWLAPVADEIASSEWFVDGDDLIVLDNGHDGQRTVVWLSGGSVEKRRYRVTNRITTASSPIARVEDRSFIVPVRDL